MNSALVKAALDQAMQIDGAIGVALVDTNSGMALGTAGGGSALNMDVAAAGGTEVVKSKLKVMTQLGIRDRIEDILITLGKAYHLINLPKGHPGLFIYLVLDKGRANLAMARHKLASLSTQIEI